MASMTPTSRCDIVVVAVCLGMRVLPNVLLVELVLWEAIAIIKYGTPLVDDGFTDTHSDLLRILFSNPRVLADPILQRRWDLAGESVVVETQGF